MVPLPVPAAMVNRLKVAPLNVAVTLRLEFIVTVQVPVPEQAPDQPAKVEPGFGVAVNVTTVQSATDRLIGFEAIPKLVQVAAEPRDFLRDVTAIRKKNDLLHQPLIVQRNVKPRFLDTGMQL